MKFIEAYASFFGTGSIFKHFNLTHHKVVFYFGMGETEEIIFLYHECFQRFFFLNLVLYYNMSFSKILTLGFVQRHEEGHEKWFFYPLLGRIR